MTVKTPLRQKYGTLKERSKAFVFPVRNKGTFMKRWFWIERNLLTLLELKHWSQISTDEYSIENNYVFPAFPGMFTCLFLISPNKGMILWFIIHNYQFNGKCC